MNSQLLVLKGGTLVDGCGGPLLPDSAVAVLGDRVAYAGPSQQFPVPADTKLIDTTGKTVLPGLIDTHIHLAGSGGASVSPEERSPTELHNRLKSYLAFGVTGVLDTGGDPLFLAAIQRRLERGELLGPRLFFLGPLFTVAGGHPLGLYKELNVPPEVAALNVRVVETPEQAKDQVRLIASLPGVGTKVCYTTGQFPGTSNLKRTNPLMPDDVLRAIVEESHSVGRPVFAHTFSVEEAYRFIEEGGDGLLHSVAASRQGVAQLAQLMAPRGSYYVPTLSVFEAYFRPADEPDLLNNPHLAKWVSRVLRETAFAPQGVIMERTKKADLIAGAKRAFEDARANLPVMSSAGVSIAAGSDSGNPLVFHGAAIHRELKLMVEAGMGPMEAIQAATATAARLIGKSSELGTIEPGKQADLIVIDGNPARRITDSVRVELRLIGGKIVEPEALALE